jgi:hypothetical protein
MADNRLIELWNELRRRKVIRVAVVYVVSAWIAVEAASVIFPALLFPEWTSRMVVALALIGFPVAVGLAWAFEIRPEGTPPLENTAVPDRAEDERLDGWKRIANYLHRDVRTVRRWEKQQNLPVRRLMHDKLATVYAYRSELDAWQLGLASYPGGAGCCFLRLVVATGRPSLNHLRRVGLGAGYPLRKPHR